jgi:hypothetical protein
MSGPFVVGLLALVLGVGCGPSPDLHTQPDGLIVFNWQNPSLCDAFGLVDEAKVRGVLRGSPEAKGRVWLESRNEGTLLIAWPAGFSVRFEPEAVLRDDTGRVVGREGHGLSLDQVRVGQRADEPAHPDVAYVASGILLGSCYQRVIR